MKKIIILVLLISNFINAQKNKNIAVVENYTLGTYSVPDSLVFYASHHYETKGFYDLIYDRVEKKTDHEIEFVFKSLKSPKKSPLFYNTKDLNLFFNEAKYACFFDISVIDENLRNYCHNGKCSFYFYMKLVEVKTNKILLSRKYFVKAKKYFYTNTKNIADIIIKDLKLKK